MRIIALLLIVVLVTGCDAITGRTITEPPRCAVVMDTTAVSLGLQVTAWHCE